VRISLKENMKTFKQLKKEQEELNQEQLECPKCGVICEWGELIEGTECGACWEYEEKVGENK